MSIVSDGLFNVGERLESIKAESEMPQIRIPLEKIKQASQKIGESWCGSSFGYHSRIYYRNFQLPPPGAHFNKERGLQDSYPIRTTTGEWVEYSRKDILKAIAQATQIPNLDLQEGLPEEINQFYDKGDNTFESCHTEILSLLTTALGEKDDPFLSSLKERIEQTKLLSFYEVRYGLIPKGYVTISDRIALNQGTQLPPHLHILANVYTVSQLGTYCEKLSKLAKQAASHLARREQYTYKNQMVGTNVFIGHGRSPLWKDLKDFIQDRLKLPWDEFNRVPVAGVTNIARLSQMLDNAAIALLVMTPEDEQADGKMHTRMNVTHEAGLFQGRLGFTKAIVLLEEGCEEFSNIHGLGQIRFPKGNIQAVFEQVRQVLEREDLISS